MPFFVLVLIKPPLLQHSYNLALVRSASLLFCLLEWFLGEANRSCFLVCHNKKEVDELLNSSSAGNTLNSSFFKMDVQDFRIKNIAIWLHCKVTKVLLNIYRGTYQKTVNSKYCGADECITHKTDILTHKQLHTHFQNWLWSFVFCCLFFNLWTVSHTFSSQCNNNDIRLKGPASFRDF